MVMRQPYRGTALGWHPLHRRRCTTRAEGCASTAQRSHLNLTGLITSSINDWQHLTAPHCTLHYLTARYATTRHNIPLLLPGGIAKQHLVTRAAVWRLYNAGMSRFDSVPSSCSDLWIGSAVTFSVRLMVLFAPCSRAPVKFARMIQVKVKSALVRSSVRSAPTSLTPCRLAHPPSCDRPLTLASSRAPTRLSQQSEGTPRRR
jgi:hypothetical protein